MNTSDQDSSEAVSPSQALVAAVMRQAIVDGDTRWVNANHHNPWGFVWICESLGMEVQPTRRMAMAAIERNKQVAQQRRGGEKEDEDDHAI